MSNEFVDHFARVAPSYASFRPRYPQALFDTLARLSPDNLRAWDCGCGSGQASVPLASVFEQVWATDASATQLAHAEPHARVTYVTTPAEHSQLDDASVSLVTVAQALHWFNVDAFHREVRRVLVPHGVIAEWSYALVDAPHAPTVAALVNGLDATLKSWWPPERRHVDEHYASLPFPFAPLAPGEQIADEIAMEAEWTAEQLLGYLRSWSAVSRYRVAFGVDPVDEVARALAAAWGPADRVLMRWPVTLRVGRVAA